MGGGGKGSKSQTIGHKYYFGEHLILSSNKLAVLKMLFQEKAAWLGRARGGDTIQVDAEELFGGESREGGVSGYIDVLDGDAEQQTNAYLETQVGTPLPAFRYMTSLVFKKFYHGNNYYPKSPSIKVLDASVGSAWYAERAFFPRAVEAEDTEILIAVDGSESMETNDRFANCMAGAAAFVRELKEDNLGNSIRGWTGGQTITRHDCTAQDYEDVALWFESRTVPDVQFYLDDVATSFASFVTNKTSATPIINTDFSFGNFSLFTTTSVGTPVGRRVCVIMSDGGASDSAAAKASFDAISRAEVFCVAIDQETVPESLATVDNTPEDGVPIPRGEVASDFLWALRNTITAWTDMNPIHMLRDALTAAEDNTNINTDRIGDSFQAAADTLYDEGFGLSFYWRNNRELDAFRTKVEEHIDAAIYFSRTTGKWEVKLIRDDYDAETLPVLNVLTWKDDVARELAAELDNKVTITYRKQADGDTKSVTVTDAASIAVTDTVRPVKIDFDGIYDDDLAYKVAVRELRNRSQPKWSGTIVVGSVPEGFDLGTPFLIQNTEYGMTSPVVCRPVEITYSVETDRNVTIKFIEDKFSLSDVVDIDTVIATPVTRDALDVTDYFIEECPYYFLVGEIGQSNADDELALEPLGGRSWVGSAKPNSYHISADYAYNEGAGWIRGTNSSFVPSTTLAADLGLDAAETTATITSTDGLVGVEAGTLARIGNEVIRLDAFDVNTNTITIGRGCLDTLPEAHSSGALIMFHDDYGLFGSTTYLSTEAVSFKVLTRTTSDTLTLAEATEHTLTFDHRAARPYRCGDLRLNDSRTVIPPIEPDTITLTWKHRDRTLQTTGEPEDYLADNIGPEAGTTYIVRIISVDDSLTELNVISETDVGAVNSYVVPDDLAAGRHADATMYAFQVISTRDGLDSWAIPTVYCSAFVAPADITLEEL